MCVRTSGFMVELGLYNFGPNVVFETLELYIYYPSHRQWEATAGRRGNEGGPLEVTEGPLRPQRPIPAHRVWPRGKI